MQVNNIMKSKLIVYALAAVSFMFFVNDYALVSADKVAIVVALGVDKGENAPYQVSAEVLVPISGSGSNVTDGDNVVLVAEGDTISSAINGLFLNTGWYPKLNYCDVILLSREIAETGAMDVLSYFLRSERILDSAIVTIADTSSKDILETITPLDNLSSAAIEKISVQRYLSNAECATTILKDFAKDYYDEGIDNIVTIVKPVKLDSKQSKQDTQTTPKDIFQLFDLSNSAIFSNGKMVGEISDKLTQAYNFATDKIQTGNYLVKDVKNENPNNKKLADYDLQIMKHSQKISVEIENNIPHLTISVKLLTKVSNTTENNSVFNLTTSTQIPANVLNTATEQLEAELENLFLTIKYLNSDIYGVGKNLHKFHLKEWREFLLSQEDVKKYMKDVKLTLDVNIDSLST